MKLTHDIDRAEHRPADRPGHPGRSSVGGLVEIVPLYFQRRRSTPVAGIKPYAPLRAGRARHLHPRGLLQLPLADDPAVPRRDRALRPLLGGRRVRLRPSVPVGQQAHRSGSGARRRPLPRRVAPRRTSTIRATWCRSRTCRRIRGSRRPQLDGRRHPAPRCARCARVGVPYTDEQIAKAPRRAQGQDRAGRADRVPAGPRHRAEELRDELHGPDRLHRAASSTVLSFVAFIGIVVWAYSKRRKQARSTRQPTRRSHCPTKAAARSGDEETRMSDFSYRVSGASTSSRPHDRRRSSAALCCCWCMGRTARQGAGAARRRRDDRPRLGRRPAGVQQSAAALVDVALLHHGRLLRRLSRPVSGARQLAGRAAAGRRAAQYDDEVAAADAKLAPLYATYRRAWTSTSCRGGSRGARRSASACSSTTARSATARMRGGARGFPNLTRQRLALRRRRRRRSRRSITDGRNGVMPPMGAALGSTTASRTSPHYVRVAVGPARTTRCKAQRGKPQVRARTARPATAPTARAIRRSARPT